MIRHITLDILYADSIAKTYKNMFGQSPCRVFAIFALIYYGSCVICGCLHTHNHVQTLRFLPFAWRWDFPLSKSKMLKYPKDDHRSYITSEMWKIDLVICGIQQSRKCYI